MPPQYQPGFSPLLRLTPLEISEIPPHPDLPLSDPKSKASPTEHPDQPDLLPFITTLLTDGLAFLSKQQLSTNFHKSSTKKAEGSIADVDILSRSLSKSALSRDVPWYNPSTRPESSSRRPSTTPANAPPGTADSSTTSPSRNLSVPTTTSPPRSRSASIISTSLPKIRRHKPPSLPDEHWFTRLSIHTAQSSKLQPGTASWEQFLFGLLSDHSKHEQAFTPNLFDAHPVVDWDGQVRKLAEEGGLLRAGFRGVRCGVWEMCHELPGVLGGRCFGVCVVGGIVVRPGDGGSSSAAAAGPPQEGFWEEGETAKFVVVTVPVQLKGVKAAFYGSGRNSKEGKDERQKREVVQGLYAAVEVCTLRNKATAAAGDTAKGGEPAEEEEEIEWIMSTASDAKGNMPMWVQKLAMPGQLPKDVSYFMKWIRSVDEEEVEKALVEFE